jgi:hypothetical protein
MMPDLLEPIALGFCDVLNKIADGLDKIVCNMEDDDNVLDTLPTHFVEQKRKDPKPIEGILDKISQLDLEFHEDQIKVHTLLEGFDENSLRVVKKRIISASKFIMGHAETKLERDIASQLARMHWKAAIVLTDMYLIDKEKTKAYFKNKHNPGKSPLNGLPHIGLDISEVIKNDDACLVNSLVHEVYHAWRHYHSNIAYSIIDEARAWNISLHFSNKYRVLYGLPVEREKDYTIGELFEIAAEYRNALDYKIKYGPGEHWIEKVGYGIANMIDDAADKVNGGTVWFLDKTIESLSRMIVEKDKNQ